MSGSCRGGLPFSMPEPETWMSLVLLSTVDMTADLETEKVNTRALLPALRRRLEDAHREVGRSLLPVDANHPAADGWDDDVYFRRAMLETNYSNKQDAWSAASERLDDLETSPDPARAVASYVLDDAHAYVKDDLGMSQRLTRLQSSPRSLGNLPLAEVIWQARNQRHHFNDQRPYDPPTIDAFRAIVGANPAAFGLQSPPPNDAALEPLLKSRSWAPEVLLLLGWTTPIAVTSSLHSITP